MYLQHCTKAIRTTAPSFGSSMKEKAPECYSAPIPAYSGTNKLFIYYNVRTDRCIYGRVRSDHPSKFHIAKHNDLALPGKVSWCPFSFLHIHRNAIHIIHSWLTKSIPRGMHSIDNSEAKRNDMMLCTYLFSKPVQSAL